jgi:hypothetical protein
MPRSGSFASLGMTIPFRATSVPPFRSFRPAAKLQAFL